jgi:beta-glucanase (GH16 family)
MCRQCQEALGEVRRRPVMAMENRRIFGATDRSQCCIQAGAAAKTASNAKQSFSGRLTLPITGASLALALLAGCGGGGSTAPIQPVETQVATPAIATTAAQNGAVVVSLSDSTAGATVYYTLDGSAPSTSSQIYLAPFLVGSNLTVNAIATAAGDTTSNTASQAFSANIPSGTLVWTDSFSNSGASNAQPNPLTWGYDVGTDCCGNNELETYCAWGSTTGPCTTSSPNAFVAPGGGLNIVAQSPSANVYTSARLKSEGLFSFMYGRIEAKILIPESQGMWPAFWMLGNNINTNPWPACGELDIMEHIDGSNPPLNGGPAPYDWYQSSVHGTNLGGGAPYTATGFSAATWHTYGMIWSKGQIQYYIDSPSNVYETFNTTNTSGTWPFDQGPMFFILNLAVGGDWPGSPDSTTVLPSTMQVQYVNIYSN